MANGIVGSGESDRGRAAEVFVAFLRLGLTSFGGPIAHLGYFREAFVVRRRWLDDHAYADLVALCQFLPGPTSSQVGFALGMMRAGWLGAFSAFIGFTLPSALILLIFAQAAPSIGGAAGMGALHGLKIVAVAIVAQAVWGMARSLCPDRERSAIAIAAVILLAFAPGSTGMLGAIALGAVAGLALGGADIKPAGSVAALPSSKWVSVISLSLFMALLLLLPLLAEQSQALAVVDRFYRAGALVFGGGHVVLPLLDAEVVRPGWVTHDAFLAGYGAAQAVPGPLFTFAAYLGAVLRPEPNGVAGAGLALLAIFLPGFLVLVGILPFWDQFRSKPVARSLMRGANAAVVGVLGAALYAPVFTSAIGDMRDFALALAGFAALMKWQAPPWLVVVLSAAGGAGLAFWAG